MLDYIIIKLYYIILLVYSPWPYYCQKKKQVVFMHCRGTRKMTLKYIKIHQHLNLGRLV